MPRRLLVPGLVIAGVALVVALYFVFRPATEEPVLVPTTAPATTESEPMPEPTLTIVIRNGQPVGGIQRLTVDRGETVSVRVTSDAVDHVHVHGYDLMADVGPAGSTAEIEFGATLVGRFEIELEERNLPIAVLEVRP